MPVIERLADVMFYEPKSRFIRQVGQVLTRACGKVINAKNMMAFTEQAISKVRTKKTGRAGDDHTHIKKYMPNGPESGAPSNGIHWSPVEARNKYVDCGLRGRLYLAILGLFVSPFAD